MARQDSEKPSAPTLGDVLAGGVAELSREQQERLRGILAPVAGHILENSRLSEALRRTSAATLGAFSDNAHEALGSLTSQAAEVKPAISQTDWAIPGTGTERAIRSLVSLQGEQATVATNMLATLQAQQQLLQQANEATEKDRRFSRWMMTLTLLAAVATLLATILVPILAS